MSDSSNSKDHELLAIPNKRVSLTATFIDNTGSWFTRLLSVGNLVSFCNKSSKKSNKRNFTNSLIKRATIKSLPDHQPQLEIDAGEPPPFDDSLFFDCSIEATKHFKLDVSCIKKAMWSTVDVTEMRNLLETGSDISIDSKVSNDQRFANAAYHWACYRDLVHLLPRLEDQSGANPDFVDPSTGMNALLVASLNNSVACLRYLLARGVDVNYVNRAVNYAPLHFAVFGESMEALELLLDSGADLACSRLTSDSDPVLHSAVHVGSDRIVKLLLERGASVVQKNHLGETALHVACFAQTLSCAEILLESPGVDVNAVDQNYRTPLHYAVINSQANPKLVELLLKFGASVNVQDKSLLTPLHIATLNEHSECVDALIWAGADISATTNNGLTALNIILRKIPETLQTLRQRLDASICLTRPNYPHNREFELQLHFDFLFPSVNQCETSFINIFVQEHQKDLLAHPLIMAFLHLKWEKIKRLYLIRIFLYALTTICLTTYVLSALAYKCYNLNEAHSSKICNSKRTCYFLFRRHIIEIEWYLAVFLTCVMIPRKIFGFTIYKSARQYFSNIDNVLDAIVICSVFVTSFIYTGRTYDWQNYVGAFAILCAWTNLMLMVGQLPAFGTYVAMFTHIQFEFAKLLLAYSGLLIGFTISFCVIFVSEPSFGNPFTGLIKVLAMMAGELDFEGLLNPDDMLPDGSFVIYHPLSVCPQILFTLFIVFVTVILMNLLVGIAVHDIQGLRRHASLTTLVRQTKLILSTEMILYNDKIPYSIKRWLRDRRIIVDNLNKTLVVQPLNPLERSLPKDVLKAAYEVAQKNPADCEEEEQEGDDGMENANGHISWVTHEEDVDSDDVYSDADQNTYRGESKRTESEIRVLRKHILDTNKMLTNLVEKVRSF